MPRRDIYHDTVKRALQKDGWTITHDPFPLQIGNKRFGILDARILDLSMPQVRISGDFRFTICRLDKSINSKQK